MTAGLQRKWTSYIYLAPYGTAFFMFVALPFVVSLALAFCQYDLTTQRPPKFVGLRNFTEALNDPFFWKAVWVTFRYVIWILPTQIVLSMLLALGMNAMTTGQRTVRALLFLPGMFSIAVTWRARYSSRSQGHTPRPIISATPIIAPVGPKAWMRAVNSGMGSNLGGFRSLMYHVPAGRACLRVRPQTRRVAAVRRPRRGRVQEKAAGASFSD